MAWIESHQTLRNHPKLKKAARKLDTERAAMIGMLHCLWWWALDYADDGCLDGYDEYDIADAADWQGDAEQFVNVLLETGFIESVDGDLHIHDWYDYAGKLIERRERNAERMRDARAANKKKRATHVQRTQRARVKLPNQTKPNQPDQTVPDQQQQPSVYTEKAPPNGHDNAAAAALIEFGISGIKREEILKSGISADYVRGWCNYAKSQPRLENPIGYAIRQMLDGKPPPESPPPQPVAIYDDNIVE